MDLPVTRVVRSAARDVQAADLTMVFENVFQNALQAGATRLWVRGSLSANETHMEVDVANDGPPVPPEVLAAMFTRRVSSTEGGTGTGLITCRDLLEKYDGTISCQSGTPVTFRITIDLGLARTVPPTGDRAEEGTGADTC